MSFFKNIAKFLFVRQWRIHKLVAFSVNRRMPAVLRRFIKNRLSSKYNICLGKNTSINGSITFPHPFNIVLGDEVAIGKECVIYQNVTLGQNRNLYPKLGDNVTVYVGATIVGGISIGDNVVIGANSFVNKDIPSNSVAVGNPVRIIRSE